MLPGVGAVASSPVSLTAANGASCRQVSAQQIFKVIRKHSVLIFQASSRENRFEGGKEDGKKADLTSQGAEPKAELELGDQGASIPTMHMRKTRLDSPLIHFPNHVVDIQAYFHHSI